MNATMWRLYLKLEGQSRFKPYGGSDALQVTNLIYSPLFTTREKNYLVSEGIFEEAKKESQLKMIENKISNINLWDGMSSKRIVKILKEYYND